MIKQMLLESVRLSKKIKKILSVWKPSSKAFKKLKILITERNSRVKMKRRLLKQQHDYNLMKDVV